MIRDIVMSIKGGEGSGFSDPNCRRGIPGQRGGSINICKPGGLAKAAAAGVDLSDVDIDLSTLTETPEGTNKLDRAHIEATRKAVEERIDEPNKVTRRRILQQQLKVPIGLEQRDRVYQSWGGGAKAAPEMWQVAGYLNGLNNSEIQERVPRGTLSLKDIDVEAWARSMELDRQLSQQTWKDGDSLYRGLKVRPDMADTWSGIVDWVADQKDTGFDGQVYLPAGLLESWTEDFGQAEQFARAWRPGGDARGLVLEQLPDPHNIFASHRALPVLEAESEVVMMNPRAYVPFDLDKITVV